MEEDGILDGDFIVVRKQATAENGETVVVLLDDQTTVKKFFRRPDHVELRPAHRDMQAILVQDGAFRIEGKVVGVMRVYEEIAGARRKAQGARQSRLRGQARKAQGARQSRLRVSGGRKAQGARQGQGARQSRLSASVRRAQGAGHKGKTTGQSSGVSKTMGNFEELKVWQRAKDLAVFLYRVSGQGVLGKDWGFRDQIRRAALSIPSNIAEGDELSTDRQAIKFFHIARGSAAELLTQSIIAHEIGYLTDEHFLHISQEMTPSRAC